MHGKQAKMVSPTQKRAMLGSLATTRSPSRDRVLFLLSSKAGLRAKEMASLTWAMVTDAPGQVAEGLHVPNRPRKGKTGRCTIPLHPDRQAALVAEGAQGHDHPRAAHPLPRAGWGAVARARALVVPSCVYLMKDGQVFIALEMPYLHRSMYQSL